MDNNLLSGRYILPRISMLLGTVMTLLFGFMPLALAENKIQPITSTGMHLASTCMGCHGTAGVSKSVAIPGLAGLPKQFIIDRMQAFQANSIPSTVMHQLAMGYTTQQIEIIAEYFSKQSNAPEQNK